MLNRNKYWKATLGQFADVLISKNVDYSGTGISTVSDYPTFVNNAVEGEFAFFNADTNALLSGIATAPANTNIFGALKRDSFICRTPAFNLNSWSAKRVVYAAAVAQISKITYSSVPVAGNYYSLKVIETTPGYQPFPSWEYGVVAKTGEAIGVMLQRMVDQVNDKLNAINKNTDSIVTATLAGSVITLTAVIAGITFRLASSIGAITDLNAATAFAGAGTANAFWGNGTYDQITNLEFESDVFKGLGTQYPGSGMYRPADMGAPSVFATVGAQYNVYIITGAVIEVSPTPVEVHRQPRTIVLAIAANGAANAEAEVKLVLGL